MKKWRTDIKRIIDSDMTGLQILKHFRNNYKIIGKGSSREVFELDENWVIKVAKSEYGEDQNNSEMTIYSECEFYSCVPYTVLKRILAKIDLKLSCCYFVVMERCQVNAPGFRIHSIALRDAYFNVTRRCKLDAGKKLKSFVKQYTNTAKHINEYDLNYGTFIGTDISPRNCGVNKRGVFKVIDYGYTKHIHSIACSNDLYSSHQYKAVYKK